MKKKQFVQLQCCLLLLALTTLPSLSIGTLVTSALGLGGLSIPVIVGRIIGLVGGCMALVSLYKGLGKSFPVAYLALGATGMFITFLTLVLSFAGSAPAWLDYIGLIVLLVAVFMGRGQFNITWKNTSAQGAYIILLATVLQVYYCIDDKFTTSIAALVGMILLLVSLPKLASGLDAIGKLGVGRLKVAAIIGIVGFGLSILLGWLPGIGLVIGILVSIANIVAFVFEMIGYTNLTKSQPLNDVGQKGAAKLRLAMILSIVAGVLSIIPVIGLLGGLLALFVLWLCYKGWDMILEGIEK